MSCCPTAEAAARSSETSRSVVGNLGSTSTAMRAAPGRNSRKSPSCFAASSTEMKLTPVTLPPGRLRLATRPTLTGSPPVTKTIGTVVVAALAASAAGVLPTIRATCRQEGPPPEAATCQFDPPSERYSIATFWPSTKPASFRPWWNAVTRSHRQSVSDPLRRNPTTGIAGLLRARRRAAMRLPRRRGV